MDDGTKILRLALAVVVTSVLCVSVAVASPKAQLTGFGARNKVWNKHHTADKHFAQGSVYDPDPNVGPSDDHDRYYAVMHNHGRVTGYSMRFPNGTTIDQARLLVQAEFPSDSKSVWFATKDTCAQTAVASRVLAGLHLSPVLVEFSSETGQGATYAITYDARNVNNATLLYAGPTLASDTLGC